MEKLAIPKRTYKSGYNSNWRLITHYFAVNGLREVSSIQFTRVIIRGKELLILFSNG
jgi:hypothetical protein